MCAFLAKVLAEHPKEYLRSGRLTAQRNGKTITVASWNDEQTGRTRTPAGHTVIALSPPLKLVHAPFVFNIEAAESQRVGCDPQAALKRAGYGL